MSKDNKKSSSSTSKSNQLKFIAHNTPETMSLRDSRTYMRGDFADNDGKLAPKRPDPRTSNLSHTSTSHSTHQSQTQSSSHHSQFSGTVPPPGWHQQTHAHSTTVPSNFSPAPNPAGHGMTSTQTHGNRVSNNPSSQQTFYSHAPAHFQQPDPGLYAQQMQRQGVQQMHLQYGQQQAYGQHQQQQGQGGGYPGGSASSQFYPPSSGSAGGYSNPSHNAHYPSSRGSSARYPRHPGGPHV